MTTAYCIQCHMIMQVSNNGLISFNSSLPSPNHTPQTFPLANNPVVAPFWADVDTRGTGKVWIRETNSSIILNRAREHIQKAFEFDNPICFQPQPAFISTWDGVGYYDSQTDLVSTVRVDIDFSILGKELAIV